MEVSNVRDMPVPFFVVLEVRQTNGITVYLAWQNSTILANDRLIVGASWIATDTGEYFIRTFSQALTDSYDNVSESQISVIR